MRTRVKTPRKRQPMRTKRTMETLTEMRTWREMTRGMGRMATEANTAKWGCSAKDKGKETKGKAREKEKEEETTGSGIRLQAPVAGLFR